MAKGIDVSFWQGDVDWPAVVGQVDFVMIKATQGKSSSGAELFEDPKFRRNIDGASAAGLKCGVYHFFTAATEDEAIREADYFISVISSYKDKIGLWAAADVETDTFLGSSDRNQLTAAVQTFCDRIAAAGFSPMVYANSYYWQNRLGDIRGAARWLALWREDMTKPEGFGDIAIWQYSSTGSVIGVDGSVDLNVGYFGEDDIPADTLSVGDTVTVTDPVIYGSNARFKLYYDRYTVMEVQGDRVVIGVDGVVTAAVSAKNLRKVDPAEGGGDVPADTLSVGDTVTVTDPVIYGSNARFKLYYDRYTVMEVQGDRVVIGVDGVVTAAVSAKNLRKV